jgi:hypothetical protein
MFIGREVGLLLHPLYSPDLSGPSDFRSSLEVTDLPTVCGSPMYRYDKFWNISEVGCARGRLLNSEQGICALFQVTFLDSGTKSSFGMVSWRGNRPKIRFAKHANVYSSDILSVTSLPPRKLRRTHFHNTQGGPDSIRQFLIINNCLIESDPPCISQKIVLWESG